MTAALFQPAACLPERLVLPPLELKLVWLLAAGKPDPLAKA